MNSELQRLKTTLFNVQTQGNSFEKSFAGAIKQVNDALNNADIREGLTKLINGIGTGAAEAAKALSVLAAHINEIAVFFGTRYIALKAISFFVGITAAVKDTTVALAGLRAALALAGGPIGIIATAVAALGVAVYKYGDKTKDAATATADLEKATKLLHNAQGDAIADAITLTKQRENEAKATLKSAKADLARLESMV